MVKAGSLLAPLLSEELSSVRDENGGGEMSRVDICCGLVVRGGGAPPPHLAKQLKMLSGSTVRMNES